MIRHMPLHLAVLVLTLARPAYTVEPAVSSAAPAGAASEGMQGGSGGMGGEGGETYLPSKEDFDEIYKKDLKILESDLKDQVKFINSRFTRETDLERGQFDKKLAFQKLQRDERIAFEKSAVESWKSLMKRLREMDPVTAAAERTAFDEKAIEGRNKFNEDAMAVARAFMEEQNAERTRFWIEIQKIANESRRIAREHETKAGKGATER